MDYGQHNAALSLFNGMAYFFIAAQFAVAVPKGAWVNPENRPALLMVAIFVLCGIVNCIAEVFYVPMLALNVSHSVLVAAAWYFVFMRHGAAIGQSLKVE